MDFLSPKCCDLSEQVNEELKDICESYVYSNDTECIIYIVDSFSRLYTVDQVTAVATLIGPVGFSSVTDIAWDGTTLYGITGGQLISINTTTGAGTLIGNYSAPSNALDADAAGVLYMMGGNNLYTLDKVTAVATLIGPMGGGLNSSGDLAFDASGNLYGSFSGGILGRINPVTAAAAAIGPFGFNPVYGLDFCNGVLYGITSGGQLLTVNTATGAGTLVGNTGVASVFGMTSAEIKTEVPCDSAELPNVEPVFTVKYGDEVGDLIEKTDVQCICITACNPYKNLWFRHVTVMITDILDPDGNPVEPKNFLFKPTRLVCFGDLAPCASETAAGCGCGTSSCASREFVLVTRDAEPGNYTIKFQYCFDVEFGSSATYTFELEVV